MLGELVQTTDGKRITRALTAARTDTRSARIMGSCRGELGEERPRRRCLKRLRLGAVPLTGC
jgi:hypothetical protein